MIYPEWIETVKTWLRNDWEVKQVLFKGCFEDLLVQHNNVTIRVLNNNLGNYKEGSKINLKLNKWLEY